LSKIVIRDSEGFVVKVAPDFGVALARQGVDRIDVWPGKNRCQVGLHWEDGATAIGDVPATWEFILAALEQRKLSGIVFLH
jgi:hypothetical protein